MIKGKKITALLSPIYAFIPSPIHYSTLTRIIFDARIIVAWYEALILLLMYGVYLFTLRFSCSIANMCRRKKCIETVETPPEGMADAKEFQENNDGVAAEEEYKHPLFGGPQGAHKKYVKKCPPPSVFLSIPLVSLPFHCKRTKNILLFFSQQNND